ncbi:hypothetical protein ACU4GR_26650 [Methylobacterium oryzae CBMB20]
MTARRRDGIAPDILGKRAAAAVRRFYDCACPGGNSEIRAADAREQSDFRAEGPRPAGMKP